MASSNSGSKHIRSFWPIVIILGLAIILGGIILVFAYNSSVQDDLYSVSFASPIQITKNSQRKVPAKNMALWKKYNCDKEKVLSAECSKLITPSK